MAKTQGESMQVEVIPASAERWNDLEALFGAKGAYANCWCMFWRLRRTDFSALKGEGRRLALRDLTCNNQVPGVLAYADGTAVGWCSISPRQQYAALENSRILKRIDDQPVWSIVCFFVAKGYRGKGVMHQLLRGAVDYARQRGASIVEAYPIDLQAPKLSGQTLKGCGGYMGIASVFRAMGFEDVKRVSDTQVIMRLTLR